jgi:hypothetical protein
LNVTVNDGLFTAAAADKPAMLSHFIYRLHFVSPSLTPPAGR